MKTKTKKRAGKGKAIRPVKAWAVVTADGKIRPSLIAESKKCCEFYGGIDGVVRVLITPIKRKASK